MDIVGKYVQHAFVNDKCSFKVERVENSKAFFSGGGFWFVDNCKLSTKLFDRVKNLFA